MVTLSGAAPTRVGWRSVAFWVVWALLFAGVFALHSVANHDAVGLRHAPVVTAVVAAPSPVASESLPSGAAVSATPAVRLFAPALADHDGIHEACILFLAGAAWVLVLLMARTIKRRHRSARTGTSHPWQRLRAVTRPPSLTAPLRSVMLRL